MITLITSDQAQDFSDKIAATSTRGGFTRADISVGAIKVAVAEGALCFIDPLDPDTSVYCHHEPKDPANEVYVNHLYANSARVLQVFIDTTKALLANGYTVAKFAVGATYSNLAAQLTGATIDPRTGLARVNLNLALTNLLAAQKAAVK